MRAVLASVSSHGRIWLPELTDERKPGEETLVVFSVSGSVRDLMDFQKAALSGAYKRCSRQTSKGFLCSDPVETGKPISLGT